MYLDESELASQEALRTHAVLEQKKKSADDRRLELEAEWHRADRTDDRRIVTANADRLYRIRHQEQVEREEAAVDRAGLRTLQVAYSAWTDVIEGKTKPVLDNMQDISNTVQLASCPHVYQRCIYPYHGGVHEDIVAGLIRRNRLSWAVKSCEIDMTDVLDVLFDAAYEIWSVRHDKTTPPGASGEKAPVDEAPGPSRAYDSIYMVSVLHEANRSQQIVVMLSACMNRRSGRPSSCVYSYQGHVIEFADSAFTPGPTFGWQSIPIGQQLVAGFYPRPEYLGAWLQQYADPLELLRRMKARCSEVRKGAVDGGMSDAILLMLEAPGTYDPVGLGMNYVTLV